MKRRFQATAIVLFLSLLGGCAMQLERREAIRGSSYHTLCSIHVGYPNDRGGWTAWKHYTGTNGQEVWTELYDFETIGEVYAWHKGNCTRR